jgi:EpsI family protein
MVPRSIVVFAVLLSATGFIAHASRAEPTPLRTSFDRFPMNLDGWTGQQLPPIDEKSMAVLRVDDYVNRAYYGPGRAGVGLYIGFYKSQRQGDSIHSPLNCLPGSGWEPLSKSYLTIPVSSGGAARDISVNRYVIEKGLDRQLVVYWYQSHDRAIASEYWSKFFLIRDAVRLNRTDAALVRVIAPIAPNADGAETRAEGEATAFVKTLFPRLSDYLPS